MENALLGGVDIQHKQGIVTLSPLNDTHYTHNTYNIQPPPKSPPIVFIEPNYNYPNPIQAPSEQIVQLPPVDVGGHNLLEEKEEKIRELETKLKEMEDQKEREAALYPPSNYYEMNMGRGEVYDPHYISPVALSHAAPPPDEI